MKSSPPMLASPASIPTPQKHESAACDKEEKEVHWGRRDVTWKEQSKCSDSTRLGPSWGQAGERRGHGEK